MNPADTPVLFKKELVELAIDRLNADAFGQPETTDNILSTFAELGESDDVATASLNEAIRQRAANGDDTLEETFKRLREEYEVLSAQYDSLEKQEWQTRDKLFVATEALGEKSQPAVQPKQPKLEAQTMRADLITSKRIEWLWRNRIPMNKLSVLTGNPDQGKSLVSLYMIAQLTRGLPMYGETQGIRGEVLLLAAEDEADDTIRPRLEAAGASLQRVHILQSVALRVKGKDAAEREAQLDTDLQAIEDMLTKMPEIKLVVIDPISSFLGRANMNREQEVRAVLTPLKNLAAKCKVAIVTIMHLNKNSDASAIHRIGGAVAFTGVARAVWLFQEDPDDKSKHLMTRVKNNIAKSSGGLVYRTIAKPIQIDGRPEYEPCIEWLGETDKTAQDVLIAGAPVGRPPEKVQDAKGWLAEFLAEGEQAAADVKSFGKRNEHSWASLRRAKEGLGVLAEQHDRQWYWRLKTSPAVDKNDINLDNPPQVLNIPSSDAQN